MRLRFSDLERIKKAAKDNVQNNKAGLKRWWSNKYKLPPNHRLFTEQSIADLNLEMYEDWMLRREDLMEMLESGDYDDQSAIRKEIDQLNKAIGDDAENMVAEDDLIEKWERQLETGEIPDLNEGLDFG